MKLADFVLFFFCCTSSWVGPSNEYRPFYEFINLKGQFANIPREKVMKPTLVRIGHWHICIVITVILGKIGTREFVISEAWLE